MHFLIFITLHVRPGEIKKIAAVVHKNIIHFYTIFQLSSSFLKSIGNLFFTGCHGDPLQDVHVAILEHNIVAFQYFDSINKKKISAVRFDG